MLPISGLPERLLRQKDRSTREVFGDYIDVYDMTQSVDDGATRPVFYESRVINLKLDEQTLRRIDAEYDAMAEEAEEYVIEKTVGAPDWTKVSELQVDNVCWLPDAGVRMEQQICHDDEKIYVHQVAREKNIRAELTDKLGSICTDSCMEFFLFPGAGGRAVF